MFHRVCVPMCQCSSICLCSIESMFRCVSVPVFVYGPSSLCSTVSVFQFLCMVHRVYVPLCQCSSICVWSIESVFRYVSVLSEMRKCTRLLAHGVQKSCLDILQTAEIISGCQLCVVLEIIDGHCAQRCLSVNCFAFSFRLRGGGGEGGGV